MSPERSPCFGCGALVPETDGPAHRYLGASPGCWELYGGVLAREYEDYALYAPVHRLTVDAYAAQHPGEPSRKAARSIAVHLGRLCLVLERGLRPERVNAAVQSISSRKHFPWLEPPQSPGEVTVEDVRGAASPEEHIERVRQWAESVWQTWSTHHETVRRWADG